jgi:hypothetical protein
MNLSGRGVEKISWCSTSIHEALMPDAPIWRECSTTRYGSWVYYRWLYVFPEKNTEHQAPYVGVFCIYQNRRAIRFLCDKYFKGNTSKACESRGTLRYQCPEVSYNSRTALGPTQPPMQWVPGALSLGVKRPGREADHSPPSSAEAKECVELYLHSNTSLWRGA